MMSSSPFSRSHVNQPQSYVTSNSNQYNNYCSNTSSNHNYIPSKANAYSPVYYNTSNLSGKVWPWFL
jgi:hypothetical protein